MTTETLDRQPRLLPLYARAVRSGLARRGGRPGELPDRELALRGAQVDRGHLAEYVRVCGGELRDILPPCYPHVLAFGLTLRLMTAPDFPFPTPGLVHVANRIRTHRPLRADQPLDLSVRATRLRDHPRGRQFDVETSAGVAGEEVWSATSTYLHRTGGGRRSRDETSAPPEPTAVWRLPADLGRRYARVSGDRNPIHLSRLAARAFGFGTVIVHGMWVAAHCAAALGPRFPEAHTYDVRFLRPVPLPGTVYFTARPDGPGWDLGVYGSAGTPHLTGSVRPS